MKKLISMSDYIIVTAIVVACTLFFGFWVVAASLSRKPPSEPLVCPPRIVDAQMAIINRRADTVICTYDGGVFASEEITLRRR